MQASFRSRSSIAGIPRGSNAFLWDQGFKFIRVKRASSPPPRERALSSLCPPRRPSRPRAIRATSLPPPAGNVFAIRERHKEKRKRAGENIKTRINCGLSHRCPEHMMNARVHAGTRVCQLGRHPPSPTKSDEFTGAQFRDFGRGTLPPIDRSPSPSLSLSFSYFSLFRIRIERNQASISFPFQRYVHRIKNRSRGCAADSRSARYKFADLDSANPTARAALIIRQAEPKLETPQPPEERASYATRSERSGISFVRRDLCASDRGPCATSYTS